MNVFQLARTGELADSLARPVGPFPSQLAVGFHEAYSEALYHQRELGVVSTTAIKAALKSAADYEAWVQGVDDEDEEPTPAISLGSAVHRAILEPARFADEYVIAPDFGPLRAGADTGISTEQGRENKGRRNEWYAAHRGATILESKSGAATLGMVSAVVRHSLCRALLEGATSELTLRWDDPVTGLPCKARSDLYRRNIATTVDVKSCLDARPAAFKRTVERFAYYLQDAHYRDGFEVLGEPLKHFAFLAVEKRPPHGIRIHMLGAPSVDAGRRQVRIARARIAEGCASHLFESYPETINVMNLSPWTLKELNS